MNGSGWVSEWLTDRPTDRPTDWWTVLLATMYRWHMELMVMAKGNSQADYNDVQYVSDWLGKWLTEREYTNSGGVREWTKVTYWPSSQLEKLKFLKYLNTWNLNYCVIIRQKAADSKKVPYWDWLTGTDWLELTDWDWLTDWLRKYICRSIEIF